MNSVFKDHFSRCSVEYARYRPRYPAELFDYLGRFAPGRNRAWDCGTGSGQAAVALADRFEEVYATDASAEQIHQAPLKSNIVYAVTAAEHSWLPDASVDLVTVAQALHWFEPGSFFSEVRRVLKKDGILAVWSYGLLQLDPALDRVIEKFHNETLKDYWPRERAMVMNGYRDIRFPFAELPAPEFCMQEHWTLDQLLGYIETWSAVKVCREKSRTDPLASLKKELLKFHDQDNSQKVVTWPLNLRISRNRPVQQ